MTKKKLTPIEKLTIEKYSEETKSDIKSLETFYTAGINYNMITFKRVMETKKKEMKSAY